MYTELETSNLQLTYELSNILRRDHITLMFDCSRYIPTNGVNYDGLPQEFQFTPYESWEQTYWRLSQNRDLHCISHARKAHLLQLMIMLDDTCVGACFLWFLDRLRSNDPMPVGPCRHCGSVINLVNYVCPSCSCSYPFVDPTSWDQHEEITRAARFLWQDIK